MFVYHMLHEVGQPERPRGLFAMDLLALDHFDAVLWNPVMRRWDFEPDIVSSYIFRTEQINDNTPISVEEAQQVARSLGIRLLSESELVAFCQQARSVRTPGQ